MGERLKAIVSLFLCLGLLLPPAALTPMAGAEEEAKTPKFDAGWIYDRDFRVDPRDGSLDILQEDLVCGPHESALLRFGRLYSSATEAGDTLGFGWRHTFDVVLAETGPQERTVVFPDETFATFRRSFEGDFVSPDSEAVLKAADDGEGHVMTEKQGATWRFDARGRLVAIEGPDGSVALDYDEESFLTRVTSSDGQRIEFVHADGLLRKATDGNGRTVTYEYDDRNLLTTVHRADGRVVRFGYDGKGYLTDINDGAIHVDYDTRGQVQKLSGSAVRTRLFSYLQSPDPTRRRIAMVHDVEGFVEATIYSADGRRIETIDGNGAHRVVHLGDREAVQRLETPHGEFQFTYDESGDLTAITGPDGKSMKKERLPDGRVRITTKTGAAFLFEYDDAGRLKKVTNPAGATMAYEYDEAGRVKTVREARGSKTSLTYDEQGRVASRTTNGKSLSYTYDAQGRPATITSGGNTVDFSYDAAGRVTGLKNAKGHEVRFTYEGHDRIQTFTGPRGHTSRYGYDERGEIASFTNAAGDTFRFDRAVDGQISGIQFPNGREHAFVYDGAGNLIGEKNAAGNQRRWFYSSAGDLMARTDFAGQKTQYVRDDLGRVTEVQYPDGTKGHLRYDEAGRLVEIENAEAHFVFAFNERGLPTSMTDKKLDRTVRYEYDAAGFRTKMILPEGTVRYAYDDLGHLIALTDLDGETTRFTYDEEGRRTAIVRPNGTTTTYAYDDLGRVTKIVTRDVDEKVLDTVSYGYDERSNRTLVSRNGKATTYRYDALNQLVGITHPDGSKESFAYDELGNRIRHTANGETTEYAYDSLGRMVRAGDVTYEWDAAGNLVRKKGPEGETRYVYNGMGKLSRVTKPDGTVVSFGYSVDGTRVWKKTGDEVTRYQYDFADVVAEIQDEKVVRSYTHAMGDDEIVALHDADEGTFYTQPDALGSVIGLTDARGHSAATYEYDAFGRTTFKAEQVQNPYRYTGRRFDAEIDLQYSRARYYDPATGRFTQRDPMGYRAGWNTYAYCMNNPLTFTDPTGLDRSFWGMVKDVGEGVGLLCGIGDDREVEAMRSAFWGGVKEDFKSGAMGDRVIAFGKGLGKGLWNAGKGTVHAVTHPVETVKGIKYAIDNWDETKERLGALVDEYVDAAYDDPEKFAEMTGVLTGEALFAVAGTKGLDKLGKARWVSKAGNVAKVRTVSTFGRVGNWARTTLPAWGSKIARGTGRLGRTIARGVANSRIGRFFARNGARVGRGMGRFARGARNLAGSTWRAVANSRPGRWIARGARGVAASRFGRAVGAVGTATAETLKAAGRTVARGARWVGRKVLKPVGLWTGSKAATVAGKIPGWTAKLAKQMGRGTWSMVKVGGIPTIVAFNDEISYYAERFDTVEEARDSVRSVVRPFLRDVDGMSGDEIEGELDKVHEAYEGYRTYLFKPVHELDTRVKQELDDINDAVLSGRVSDDAIEERIDNVFSGYAVSKHRLIRDVFTRDKNFEHGWDAPSPNRPLTYDDEVALYEKALERVDSPEVREAIERRIERTKKQKEEELQLLAAGKLNQLLPSSVGGFGDPGMDVPPGFDETTPEAETGITGALDEGMSEEESSSRPTPEDEEYYTWPEDE